MPEPISRSTVSQIASYGPPEELSSQATKAETPIAKAALPATSDLFASHAALEKVPAKPLTYEKCIALHEKASLEGSINDYRAAGCFTTGYPAMVAGGTTLGPVGAVAGGVLGCLAGAKLGRGIGTGPLLAEGNMEGRIACDDLPKKL